MSVSDIIWAIVIAGVILSIMETSLPIDPKVRRLLQAIVVGCLVVWILQGIGVLHTHIKILSE